MKPPATGSTNSRPPPPCQSRVLQALSCSGRDAASRAAAALRSSEPREAPPAACSLRISSACARRRSWPGTELPTA
eukprot:3876028-Pyramimonas_sp.AAC.1